MSIRVEHLVGHVCFYCCKGADQTANNPSRTTFCDVCGHRGEGIQRELKRGAWGSIVPVLNVELTK